MIDNDLDCLLLAVALTTKINAYLTFRPCFYRELNWQIKHTDFSLRTVEAEKFYVPHKIEKKEKEQKMTVHESFLIADLITSYDQ